MRQVHERLQTKIVRREKYINLSHREMVEAAVVVAENVGVSVPDCPGLRLEVDGPGTFPSFRLVWTEDEAANDVGGVCGLQEGGDAGD